MTTKTQEEMLQPVNGYQLESVTTKLSNLEIATNKRFDTVDGKLDTIIAKDSATCAYVDKKINDAKDEIYKTVDLKYGRSIKGYNKAIWIFLGAVISGVVSLLINWWRVN